MITASELLREAARIIEENGLCKGTFWYRDYVGPVDSFCVGTRCCAYGALLVANGRVQVSVRILDEESSEFQRALFTLRTAIGPVPDEFDGESDRSVMFYWSDLPEQTASTVASMLRQAAAQC